MDWNIRRRVCSARKGQKRVESLGVRVSDLRPSVMRMDLGRQADRISAPAPAGIRHFFQTQQKSGSGKNPTGAG